MMSIYLDNINVEEISADKNIIVKFLQRLPSACREVGLDPEKTELIMRIIPERPDGHIFKGQIFMGAGEHSMLNCGLLFGRLEEALSILSGMQQNGGMGSEFDEDSDRKGDERLEAIVRDMAMALTGKEIDIR